MCNKKLNNKAVCTSKQPFVFIKNKLTIKFIYIIIFFSIILIACTTSSKTNSSGEKIIASINDANLYQTDIASIPKELSTNDSMAFATSMINKWASDEAFYTQALVYLSDEEKDIEQEINTYKKELLSYRFQVKLINDKLDTLVSDKQIEKYYDVHSENFLLKQNIVKVLYVKTPNNIPNIDKLKGLCKSNNEKDVEQLKILCVQYANNYFMNDNTWLLFDDLKKEINQLKDVPDYSIQNGKVFEFTDATSYYFLKVIEVKSKNTISPLNFEKTNIKNMLLNQRKQKLINTIRKDFFEKVKTNNELKIYK